MDRKEECNSHKFCRKWRKKNALLTITNTYQRTTAEERCQRANSNFFFLFSCFDGTATSSSSSRKPENNIVRNEKCMRWESLRERMGNVDEKIHNSWIVWEHKSTARWTTTTTKKSMMYGWTCCCSSISGGMWVEWIVATPYTLHDLSSLWLFSFLFPHPHSCYY